MARNWTKEDRINQARIIRDNKPWEKSTGPRTFKGRAITKYNALKHGMRSSDAKAFLRLRTHKLR